MDKIEKLFILLFAFFCAKNTPEIPKAEEALKKRYYSKALFILDPISHKKNPKIKYLLGKAHLGLKNPKEVARYFDEAVKLDSSYTDSVIKACINRGIELSRIGEYEVALCILKYAEKFNKNKLMTRGFSAMGDIYKAYGEIGKAEYYYNLAIKNCNKEKEREKMWIHLMELYEKSKDWENACRVCLEAMRKDKLWHLQIRYTEYSYRFAEELFKQGKIDSANIVMEEASKLEIPNMLRADFYFLYGEILLAKGELEKAKEKYKLVLSCEIQSPSVRTRARERLRMIGR